MTTALSLLLIVLKELYGVGGVGMGVYRGLCVCCVYGRVYMYLYVYL